jgi:hypothetical protein
MSKGCIYPAAPTLDSRLQPLATMAKQASNIKGHFESSAQHNILVTHAQAYMHTLRRKGYSLANGTQRNAACKDSTSQRPSGLHTTNCQPG